jgi:polar amino acid transport system substrate-binding protein
MRPQQRAAHHPIFDPVTGFKVAFHDRRLRDAFNREMRNMREDQSCERIVERYPLPSR